MNRTAKIAFFVLSLFVSHFGGIAAAAAQVPASGEAWNACLEHPTRTCIIDEAEETARAMENGDARMYELLRIAGVHARAGQTGKARELLTSASDAPSIVRIGVLSDIARAESALVPTDEMVAVYKAAVRRAELETSPLARAEHLKFVAQGGVRAGLGAEAAATYEQAFRCAQAAKADWGTQSSSPSWGADRIFRDSLAMLLRGIAADRADAGNIAFALTVATTINGDSNMRARALLAVARAQLKEGSKDDARATLDMALPAAREILQSGPVSIQYVKLLADIAQAQSAAGIDGKAAATFGEATATAPWIEPDWERGRALPYIAAVQKAAGLEGMAAATRDRLLPAARKVRVTRARVDSLTDAAETLAKAEQSREAADAFAEAFELADGIGSGFNRVEALISVAAAQARAKSLTEARNPFKWALQATLSGVDFGQTDLLLGLAQKQMEAGFAEDARTTFAQWLEAEPLRTDGSTSYRALWVDLTRPATSLLMAGAGARGHRQILNAAHAIDDTRLRAEVLRKIAELDPER